MRPKPMVIGSHPEDLCSDGPLRVRDKFSFKMLLPTERGFPIRHYFGAKTPQQFHRVNRVILEYLQQKTAVQFLTVADYVNRHLQDDNSNGRDLQGQ